MKKWIYEAVIVVVVLCVAGGIWWHQSTKEQRRADAQYEQLIKFANRQAVEIAIIEQASKLEDYKQQMEVARQARNLATMQPVTPNLLMPMVMPPIADPNDVNVSKIP